MIVRKIPKKLTNAVIRAMSNAALNAREGVVLFTPHLKQLFCRRHHHFDHLTDIQYPIQKRTLRIQQRRLLHNISAVLGTVLGSFSWELISSIVNRYEYLR